MHQALDFIIIAAIIILGSLTLFAQVQPTEEIYAIPVAPPCLNSSFVRIDNEQFSTSNVTVGASVIVTGELKNQVNREVLIKPLPIADKEKATSVIIGEDKNITKLCYPIAPSLANDIIASNWQVVKTSFPNQKEDGQVSIAPGQILPFMVEIRPTEQGNFTLATAIVFRNIPVNSTTDTETIYIGRGQSIHVLPSQAQLAECRQLGIKDDKCTDSEILQKTAYSMPSISEDRRRAEDQQNQINNSMYLIGIGAAIAGIIAYITLRRTK